MYKIVPVGTPVTIVDQPFKMGWDPGELYLEVHPPVDEDTHRISKGMTAITELLVNSTSESQPNVDWDAVEDIFDRADRHPAADDARKSHAYGGGRAAASIAGAAPAPP